MQMKNRGHVDYQHIAPEHQAIHARLQNWRRWLGVGGMAWTAHPMWRHLKEKEERESGRVTVSVDAIDGHQVEKAVYALPEKHRFAIRWWYVFSGNPSAAARHAAVTKERLAELVKEGRTMLCNRLQPIESKVKL